MDQGTLLYLAFFLLAGLTLLAALAVVTLRNLLHSALALVVTFIGVAGLYLLLQAEFIAMVQVLLYIGAVMVLILFAIMLTQRLVEERLHQFTGKWWVAAPLALLLLVLIVPAVLTAAWVRLPAEQLPEDAVAALGSVLMNRYILPFEIASVLLLVALVGAIVVAWPMQDRLPVVAGLQEKVALPPVEQEEISPEAEACDREEPAGAEGQGE